MKLKRFLAIGMIILLIAALLASCGGSASYKNESADFAGGADAPMDAGASLTDQSSTGSGSITPKNQKLIRTLYVHAETENMDAMLPKVETKVAELGGYIEGREVYNGSNYSSHRYRNAELTIRVPADQLDAFVEHVSDSSNVVSNRETTEDVTLKYVATQSRITALETEQTRLLELLEKAETMEDLLQIESRLTDVRAELEEVTSQLRLYDNLVDYGTIHLSLEEVVEYTEPEPESVWERMGAGFMDSLEGLGDGIVELFVWVVASLPYLVLIAVIAVVVFALVKRRKKKKTAKTAPKEQ